MALVGYELEKKKIDEKMAAIRAQLGGRGPKASAGPVAAAEPKRRVLSAAARRRIAAAQRRRWAEHRRKAKLAKRQARKSGSEAA